MGIYKLIVIFRASNIIIAALLTFLSKLYVFCHLILKIGIKLSHFAHENEAHIGCAMRVPCL